MATVTLPRTAPATFTRQDRTAPAASRHALSHFMAALLRALSAPAA